MRTADLYRESVFIVVSVAVHVVADQLLAVLILDGNHRLEELNQSLPLQWKQTVTTPGYLRLLLPCFLWRRRSRAPHDEA